MASSLYKKINPPLAMTLLLENCYDNRAQRQQWLCLNYFMAFLTKYRPIVFTFYQRTMCSLNKLLIFINTYQTFTTTKHKRLINDTHFLMLNNLFSNQNSLKFYE